MQRQDRQLAALAKGSSHANSNQTNTDAAVVLLDEIVLWGGLYSFCACLCMTHLCDPLHSEEFMPGCIF